GDPVRSGIGASLAAPGGNVTGLSSQAPDTAGKKLQLLREVIPGLRRLAILSDVGNPNATRQVSEVQGAAHTVGIEVVTFEIRRAAVGPGGRDEAGKIIKPDVKTGDRVLFGKWSGKLDGEDLLIMKESDIMGVIA